ncbi:hypothetical protein [Methanotorris igneus]|uniref:hypothetical protein n=1 Tax=Methanotorris igneus TaxID=2189 RepID=UPI0012F6DB35|nr:hypothetical protein [Methanotorris igneus]
MIDKYLTDKIEQPKRRGLKDYDLVLELRLLVYGVKRIVLYERIGEIFKEVL